MELGHCRTGSLHAALQLLIQTRTIKGPTLDFLLLYLPSHYSFAHCSFIFLRVHFLFSPLFLPPSPFPHPNHPKPYLASRLIILTVTPYNLLALLIISTLSISTLLWTRPLSCIHLTLWGMQKETEKDHRKQFRSWILFGTRALLTSSTVYCRVQMFWIYGGFSINRNGDYG